MPSQSRSHWTLRPTRRRLLVLALAGLVQWSGGSHAAERSRRDGRKGKTHREPAPEVILGTGEEGLPPAVADMRAAILEAVGTGQLAELKGAMDLNELKPEFGGPVGVDSLQYLASRSADGTGKDILAIIATLLDGRWAAIPGGRDIENNRMYVWPHFAEVPLKDLSTEDAAALEKLVGADKAKAIIEAGRWSWWRLSIGADGVWHMFSEVK